MDNHYKRELVERFQISSAMYLREKAYENGSNIWKFLKKSGFGENDIGVLMDASAQGKGVINHRLYGHHIIYDFPVSDIYNSKDFIEHLLSDFVTRIGLPIIPAEILNKHGLVKNFDTLTNNWNFLNAFDCFSGILSIMSGLSQVSSASNNDFYESESQAAISLILNLSQIGVGVGTANILLVIGGTLGVGATVFKLQNNISQAWLASEVAQYSLEHICDQFSLEPISERYSIDSTIESYSLENEINKYKL